ncbi:hypothetical protein quinque_002451 [Culex quinquefasciatus]
MILSDEPESTCFGTIGRTRTASKARGVLQTGTGKYFRAGIILRKYLGTRRQKMELKSKKIKRATGGESFLLTPVHQRARTRANIRAGAQIETQNNAVLCVGTHGRNHGQTQTKNHQHTWTWTPRHDFNVMDCTDIVIGTAREETYRVCDYYTRDRSTPRGLSGGQVGSDRHRRVRGGRHHGDRVSRKLAAI